MEEIKSWKVRSSKEASSGKQRLFSLKAVIEVLIVISIISSAVADSDKQAEQAIIQTL